MESEREQISSGSRALRNILVDLNNSVVGIILILLLIPNYFSLLYNLMGIIPSTLIAISITVPQLFLAL